MPILAQAPKPAAMAAESEAGEGRVSLLLKEQGLSARSLTAGLVIHEIFGAALLFGGWYAAYRILRTPLGLRVTDRAYAASPWLRAARDRTSEVRAHRFLQRLPPSWTDHLDLKVAGYVNSTVARKLCAPVLVPAKIIASVQAAKALFPVAQE